jgi:peptidoglycan/xylan/chitin deacetylase (PgdA/CDA1 family)
VFVDDVSTDGARGEAAEHPPWPRPREGFEAFTAQQLSECRHGWRFLCRAAQKSTTVPTRIRCCGMTSSVPVAVVRRLAARRSVVVGGHGVAAVAPGHDPENLCVHPDRFRAQVELLLEGGFRLVTVSALVDAGEGDPPPPGLAALSFDDGMDNNLTTVLPLLREYGVPATVYAVSGRLEEPHPSMAPEAGSRILTAAELRELAATGIEIGAHTVSHPDLSALGAAACAAEVAGARTALEALLGRPVRSFAYPFNRAGGHAIAAVREAGYASAVVGHRRGPWSALEVPRAMVTGVDGLPAFVAKLAGVYEPVFRSTPVAGLRAATRRPRLIARRLRHR